MIVFPETRSYDRPALVAERVSFATNDNTPKIKVLHVAYLCRIMAV